MSDGNQQSDNKRPESAKSIPDGEGERKVWAEVYPGEDMVIEVGHMDNVDDLYLQSGEAQALRKVFGELFDSDE